MSGRAANALEMALPDLLRRPFARPSQTLRDLRALRRMLERVRQDLVGADPDTTMLTVTATEPDGRPHQTVLARLEELRRREAVVVVGFFGQMRRDSRVGDRIWQADADLIAEFPAFPGLLSYSSLLLPDGDWGDLALFTDAAGMQDWGQSRIHRQAVHGLAHRHYLSVRLHFGTLQGRLAERPHLEMAETLYLDYATSPPEQARVSQRRPPIRLR